MTPERNGRAGAPPALGAHVRELLRLPDGAVVWLDDAPAYDLVQGLMGLVLGPPKGAARAWVALARDSYTAAQWDRMRLWFGGESPVGSAFVALVPLLPGAGAVEELLETIERLPVGDFLRVAVTAGSVDPDAPLASGDLLALGESPAATRAFVDRYLRLLGKPRALVLRLLADPEAARAELLEVLRTHTAGVYARLAPEMNEARGRAVERLRELAISRPEVVAGWLRGRGETAGFAPLVVAPLGAWPRFHGVYMHESRQPLFEGSAYEPLLVLIGAARVLAEEPLVSVAADPAERWASLFAALADPTRLRLLRLLAERPHYGQELAPALGVSGPTVSHHLGQLHRAGIVAIERRAHRTYLVLRREALAGLLAAGGRFLLEKPGEESASRAAREQEQPEMGSGVER